MVEKTLKVTPLLGLHARPAAMFAQEVSRFKSTVKVVKAGVEVNGKSVMGLMLLAAEKGSLLTIRVEGPDEAEVIPALEALFERKFDEE